MSAAESSEDHESNSNSDEKDRFWWGPPVHIMIYHKCYVGLGLGPMSKLPMNHWGLKVTVKIRI